MRISDFWEGAWYWSSVVLFSVGLGLLDGHT